MLMRHFLFIWTAVVSLSFGSVATADTRHGTFPTETIKVGKLDREYRLVVPKSVDLTKPAPLVFAFHGFLVDSKDVMPRYTKLDEAAEKYHFLLVYPNAIDRSWALTPDKMIKDLAFFDALLKRL